MLVVTNRTCCETPQGRLNALLRGAVCIVVLGVGALLMYFYGMSIFVKRALLSGNPAT